MNELPIDLLFNILNYNSNINILLNKEYYTFIKKIKDNFKNVPLKIEYRLLKCKRRVDSSENAIKYRRTPSIKATDKKILELNGSIPLGEIIDNTIIPSIELKKKIIPSEEKYVYPYYMWNLYPDSHILIYWEIFNIKILNMKRTKIYQQLF